MIKGNITFDNAGAYTTKMLAAIQTLKDDRRIICEEVRAYADHVSNGSKEWLNLVINAICTFPELGDHPDYPGEPWLLSLFPEGNIWEVHTFLHEHDNIGDDGWTAEDIDDIVEIAIISIREVMNEHK